MNQRASRNASRVQDDDKLTHQRRLANMRERRRMILINRGFELLRTKLVQSARLSATIFDQRESVHKTSQRLTKADILRLTIDYIKTLSRLAQQNNSEPVDQASGLAAVARCRMEVDERPLLSLPDNTKPQMNRIIRTPPTKRSVSRSLIAARAKPFVATRSSVDHATRKQDVNLSHDRDTLRVKFRNSFTDYVLSWSRKNSDEDNYYMDNQKFEKVSEAQSSSENQRLVMTRLWAPERG